MRLSNGKSRISFIDKFRNRFPIRIVDNCFYRNHLIQIFCLDAHQSLVLFYFGMNEIIINALLWSLHQIHIPKNPIHTKFVLILQITPVTPFQN